MNDPPGLHSGESEVESLRAQLNQVRKLADELTERLKNTTVSMEQYKAMCLNLEESLDKEKQVKENIYDLIF